MGSHYDPGYLYKNVLIAKEEEIKKSRSEGNKIFWAAGKSLEETRFFFSDYLMEEALEGVKVSDALKDLNLLLYFALAKFYRKLGAR